MNPMMFPLTLLGLLPINSAAIAQQAADVPADQARAQAAMADLGQRLKSALVAKMQAQGPLAAVDFCHAQAPQIAADVSAEHGIAVGRTALRVRNPSNAPAPWQEAVLTQFLQQSQAGTPPGRLLHVERESGGLRVARGIATEGPCLVCHGHNIAEPVRDAIKARYPDDAATGFSEGELRGLIWAEIPDAPAPAGPSPGIDHDAAGAATEDPRQPITLDPAARESLRAEMRWRMELLSRAMRALADGDWSALQQAGESGTDGTPRGVDFRVSMPEGWFAMSRPLHRQFAELAAEARGAQRKDVAMEHIARASAYCAACHAAYRIQ